MTPNNQKSSHSNNKDALVRFSKQNQCSYNSLHKVVNFKYGRSGSEFTFFKAVVIVSGLFLSKNNVGLQLSLYSFRQYYLTLTAFLSYTVLNSTVCNLSTLFLFPKLLHQTYTGNSRFTCFLHQKLNTWWWVF